MTKYKCGHESETIILDCNELSIGAFLTWLETDGWKGDKSRCWDCYNKESK